MPDLDETLARLERMRAKPAARDWFRIEAKVDTKTAEVWIYDEIGAWGTNARDFARDLRAVDADTITLHLNSPGGDAFDGIAIYNSLKDHPASVTVLVDGLAASAASVIAQAGDTVRMNRGAQMMIHDASGLVIGNASDMAGFAAVLEKTSDSIASAYASRAGGTVAEWREVMRAETWYTAAEAVEAGLADEAVDDEPADPPVKAAWDLAGFAWAYAGRDAAPAPVIPRKPEPTPVTAAEAARRIHAASTKTPTAVPAAGPTQEGAGRMDPAKIREALGLAPDVSDEQVFAALASARPSAPPTETEPAPAPKAPTAPVSGTMTIDVSAWAEQQDRIKRLEATDARRRRDERDAVIAQAVSDGKFAPARTEHWARLWDADPEGTRTVIESLAKNVIPVVELGYSADGDSEFDDEFARFFPPEPATRKGA
ncbi:head maturation protease, ClpP-related [Plantactinospora solaniradicis]|uniref:ATP-dependent Clp protease proteolytic subunit n=1 Tax=Plantactinospora solaniradicis TaxID=1723736 RepID=A0ABW1K980_9ACTN